MRPVLELTLILHSTWRWAVIFTLAVVLLDGLLALSGHPPDRAASRKRFKLLVVAMDVQFLVGILVYAQSPLVRLAWQRPRHSRSHSRSHIRGPRRSAGRGGRLWTVVHRPTLRCGSFAGGVDVFAVRPGRFVSTTRG